MFRLSTVADFNLSVRFGREMMKLLDAFNALQIEKCYIYDIQVYIYWFPMNMYTFIINHMYVRYPFQRWKMWNI